MEIRLSHALMGLGALVALALFGFLASSVITPAQSPTPTATVTLPTPTPSPTWTPRPTAIPSPTPTPPVQAVPQPIRSNLRSGPGLTYDVVATAAGDATSLDCARCHLDLSGFRDLAECKGRERDPSTSSG